MKESDTSNKIFEMAAGLVSLWALYELANGAFPYRTRRRIIHNADHTCEGCGVNGSTPMTAHHKLPVSRAIEFGVHKKFYDHVVNGECLCRSCHDKADEFALQNPVIFLEALAQRFPRQLMPIYERVKFGH